MMRHFQALLILPLLALHALSVGSETAHAGVWRGERILPAWCVAASKEAVRVSKRTDREQRFKLGDFSDKDCSNPRYRVSRIHDRKDHLYWTVPFKGWFLECRCRLK